MRKFLTFLLIIGLGTMMTADAIYVMDKSPPLMEQGIAITSMTLEVQDAQAWDTYTVINYQVVEVGIEAPVRLESANLTETLLTKLNPGTAPYRKQEREAIGLCYKSMLASNAVPFNYRRYPNKLYR